MTAEDKLQELCVAEFDRKYPEFKLLLFHVANERKTNTLTVRGKTFSPEGMRLIKIGQRPGVADLILLTPRHGYGSLCLEAKVRKGDIYRIGTKNIMVKQSGKQSEAQHAWELAALSAGNKYVLFWSVNEFMQEVDAYLK